jgi:ABC-type Na+ efflux pump permease subunit
MSDNTIALLDPIAEDSTKQVKLQRVKLMMVLFNATCLKELSAAIVPNSAKSTEAGEAVNKAAIELAELVSTLNPKGLTYHSSSEASSLVASLTEIDLQEAESALKVLSDALHKLNEARQSQSQQQQPSQSSSQ